jgi:hypothetical protein
MDLCACLDRKMGNKMATNKVEEIPMKVIHINDLRRNKKISGRAKDLNDLENLSKI